MNDHDEDVASTRRRKTGREEELCLCDEALKSGKYDQISDAAWIILCEEAAAKGRKSSQTPKA